MSSICLAKSFRSALLMSLFMLISSGCGSGNSSGTSATTTQPTAPTAPPTPAAPPVPAGWVKIDQKYFSFSYPSTWQLTENASATIPFAYAAEPGLQHQVGVQFEKGFVNKPSATKQCPTVDAYLVSFYNTNFLPLATDPSKFPNTTTTYSLPDPGPLGGETITVSVVSVDKDGGLSGDAEYYIEAVPHKDGLYLVLYGHPSEPLNTWVSFRDTFTGTIGFTSAALSSTPYCNYKG